MDWLYALGLIAVIVLLAPLWTAIIRDAKRRRGGGLGAALGEANALIDPSRRHAHAVQEQRQIEEAKGDPPL